MRYNCWILRLTIWTRIWVSFFIIIWQYDDVVTATRIRGNKVGSAISIQDHLNNEVTKILSKSSSLPGNAIVSKLIDNTKNTNSVSKKVRYTVQQQVPSMTINTTTTKNHTKSYHETFSAIVYNINHHWDERNEFNTSIYIPNQFKMDRNYIAQVPQPFPRWKEDKTDPKLLIDSIIEFITYQNQFYEKYLTDPYYSVSNMKLSQFKLPMNYTSDHPKGVVHYWRPETLYIVSSDGIYCSKTAKVITDRWSAGNSGTFKMVMTENIMARAYYNLVHSPTSQRRWPLLHQTIVQKNTSLPFLAHYSDYKGCNYQNWHGRKSSLPLYTVAASMDCYNTFPFPNYRTGRYQTRSNVSSWDRSYQKRRELYKDYSTRIPQIVWRGSLTGFYNETIRPPRYHLLKLVNSKKLLTAEERSLFNIKLTAIGPPADSFLTVHAVKHSLGGVSKKSMSMEDFQKYKAVLDVDGHSWSSRFGDLLCYNTVVLKVDPEWVDYFYYPKNTSLTLLPWKHYIPIQRNLSDLVEKAKYVLDPKNEAHIQQIIFNANQWCYTRMLDSVVAEDALDIWEYNVKVLNDNDPSWSTKWNQFVKEQSNLIPHQSHGNAKIGLTKHPQQMSKIEEIIFKSES